MKKCIWLLAALFWVKWADAAPRNVIVILTDDQGYEDLSCFGSARLKTPNIDRMAEEGIKLTSFYTASSVCTPSRAGLLTGRLPKRVGLPKVLFPYSDNGLSPDEITIAELLKEKGYATAIIGKWHLGYQAAFLPTRQGFDSYFGIPYSNNMTIAGKMKIAEDVVLTGGYSLDQLRADMDAVNRSKGKVKALSDLAPLMRGDEVVEYPADQATLTARYTEEAVAFIEANQEKPFFLYLAHSFPHTPLFAGKAFQGSSGHGIYPDVIQELDWSVGQVLRTLKEHGLEEDTLVIFCSDNGPAPGYGRGSAKPLSGTKFETLEGGQRVPAIVWAPGLIPSGSVRDEILSTLDLFPTIAHYTGCSVPGDREYDGYDISGVLEGRAPESPRSEMYFYTAGTTDIDGIRIGDWKYLNHGYKGAKSRDLTPDQIGEKLFNLREDIGETRNLIHVYPEKAKELKRKMKTFDGGIQ